MRNALGDTMRKIALLLAAAMFVSAPLIAAWPTLTYAAAKKAKAKAAPAAKAATPSPEQANTAFLRAVGDLGTSLSQPWPSSEPKGKAKAKTAKGKAKAK